MVKATDSIEPKHLTLKKTFEAQTPKKNRSRQRPKRMYGNISKLVHQIRIYTYYGHSTLDIKMLAEKKAPTAAAKQLNRREEVKKIYITLISYPMQARYIFVGNSHIILIWIMNEHTKRNVHVHFEHFGGIEKMNIIGCYTNISNKRYCFRC